MRSDDLDAIKNYFDRTAPQSSAADIAKQSFYQWWSKIGFFGRHLSDGNLAEAQRRKISFDAANGVAKPASDGGLTAEEQDYFANMPSVDVTGLPPAAVKLRMVEAAKDATFASKPPPGSILALQYGTLKTGSKGDGVKRWQAAIQVNQTGTFDAATTAATKTFQTAHGIKADGVVGPASWTAALGSKNAVINPADAVVVASLLKQAQGSD
jgi:peptidoglycan hydrolase-like protein with peptidoglycan-binding domain